MLANVNEIIQQDLIYTCVVVDPASSILTVEPGLKWFDNFSVRQTNNS